MKFITYEDYLFGNKVYLLSSAIITVREFKIDIILEPRFIIKRHIITMFIILILVLRIVYCKYLFVSQPLF